MKTNLYAKLIFLKAFLVATAFGVISCNNNKASQSNSSMNTASISDTIRTGKDAQFLSKAAMINLEEIRLGQLAQQNSSTPDIKELGKMLEEDHNKLQDELVVLARNKSITLPASLDSNAQADYKNLSNKTGTDFDKAYTDMMVNGHREAIALFKSESDNATDGDIRKWAAATLPTLNKHLNQSITCQAKCKSM